MIICLKCFIYIYNWECQWLTVCPSPLTAGAHLWWGIGPDGGPHGGHDSGHHFLKKWEKMKNFQQKKNVKFLNDGSHDGSHDSGHHFKKNEKKWKILKKMLNFEKNVKFWKKCKILKLCELKKRKKI